MAAEPTSPDAGSRSAAGARRRAADAAHGVRTAHNVTTSLGDLVFDRVNGPIEMTHVLTYIALWGVFYDKTGREPRSVRELALACDMSPSTLDRWSKKFHKAFPEYPTPRTLWAIARETVTSQRPDVMVTQLGAAQL